MSKKLQMVLLALGLSVVIAFVGCDDDDDEDTGPTITPPNAPTGVLAERGERGEVNISWTESALDDAPDGYAIERRQVGSDTWTEIGSVLAGISAYVDDTIELGSGNTYEYQVVAYNDGGETVSLSSSTVTVRTFAELLVGIWKADENNPNFVELGFDSAKVEFYGDNTFTKLEFFEDFSPLDSEVEETGTYTADGTTITFMLSAIDGEPIDSTFTWDYSHNYEVFQIILTHNYEEGGDTWAVPYDDVTPSN